MTTWMNKSELKKNGKMQTLTVALAEPKQTRATVKSKFCCHFRWHRSSLNLTFSLVKL